MVPRASPPAFDRRSATPSIDVPPPPAHLVDGPEQLDRPLAERLRAVVGTSRSGSKSCRIAQAVAVGHIPCGLLKLNSCGLGGS